MSEYIVSSFSLWYSSLKQVDQDVEEQRGMNKNHGNNANLRALIDARLQRGWTQAELAVQVGVVPQTVIRWENGTSIPFPLHRTRLEELLQIDAHEVWPPQRQTLLPPLEKLDRPHIKSIFDPSLPTLPEATSNLIGREDELAQLKQRLCSGGGNAALSAVNGLPGVGKTAILTALAHDSDIQSHFQHGILWAGLGPTANIQAHLSRWGTLLGLSSSEISTLSGTSAWAIALRRTIGTRTMLLVIDDAWTLEEALILKVGGPNCVHLVSTRFPSIAAQMTADGALTIKELNSEKSMFLLRMLAPQIVEKEMQRAHELALAVGGLPLALQLIGNYLRTQSYSGQARRITAALQRLNDANERLNLSKSRGPVEQHPNLPDDTPVSLSTIIAVTYQQLDRSTRMTLHALSAFPAKPNSFSEEAALAVADCDLDTLDQLTDTGLLESNSSDRYTLHQTIADYARIQLSDTTPLRRLVTYSTDFVTQYSKDYTILEAESRNILTAMEAAYQHSLFTELTQSICAFTPFLLSRGLYQTADVHLQRSYQSALMQNDSSRLANTLLSIGEMTWKQGSYEKAEQYLQEGLKYARRINDIERICAILNNLGLVTWKLGNYQLAEVYLQEGLKLAYDLGNQERICGLLDILGSVAMRQGNYTQSEEYLLKGLALARQAGEKALICSALLSLGVTAGEQGNYTQATSYFQESLVLARELNHREWITAVLNNLGDIALECKNYDQAEHYFAEGLDAARQIDRREWISMLSLNLGLISRKQQKYAVAEDYLREGLDLARQIGIPQIISHGLYEYGNLYLDQQQLTSAEETFSEILTTVPKESHDLIALAQYGLGRTADAQGKKDVAIALGEKSAQALEKIGYRNAHEVRLWLESLKNV